MNFPILLSTFTRSPRQRERFLAAVQAADAAREAGTIANPVYQDAKQTINRALETASSYDNRAVTGLDVYVHPQLHTIAGMVKKFHDNPQVIAFMQEIAPLGRLFDALKPMVTKRQPKPVEERKPGYNPPQVSSQAQAQVVALLEQVTEESYTALRQGLATHMRQLLTNYLAAQKAETERELSPYAYFVGRNKRSPDHESYHIVSLLTNSDYSKRGWLHYVAKADAEAIIAREATNQADEIRTAFVHKNYRKIASIIDAKGNYASGEEVEHSVSLGGLRGSFVFTFTDASRFMVTNQVVFVVNQQGTRFLRFPLTFHAVVLPNGKPMARPSEERMNEIFARA